jgi:hypothetical protein
MKEVMKDIPIRNKEFKKTLDKFLWFTQQKVYQAVGQSGASIDKTQAHYYTSEEYRDKIISLGATHDGFPDSMRGYSFQHTRMKLDPKGDLDVQQEIVKKHAELIFGFEEEYALKNNALFVLYPPGGYISWHNNANASAYNIILTWSENGNGHFSYVDPNTGKTVRMQDKPGWQCKLGFFGSYEDPKSEMCYHAAYTDCWRMTISFIFDRSEESQFLQEMFLEEIQSEE